jgi:hypothetical protein
VQSTGGSTQPASPPPSGGRGGGGSGGSGGTIICDNTGGYLPMTCTACTPDMVVPAGQKVLLSLEGTCALIN